MQEFWPCPCRGEHTSGKNAGPCDYEPAAQKINIKGHLKSRHGKTEHEAATLMAALVPIVRA